MKKKVKDLTLEEMRKVCENYFAKQCVKCPVKGICKMFLPVPKNIDFRSYKKEVDL